MRLHICYVFPPLLESVVFSHYAERYKSIQKLFTMRLCGTRLSQVGYVDRLKLEALEKKRVKFYLIFFQILIYSFCDFDVSKFMTFLIKCLQ